MDVQTPRRVLVVGGGPCGLVTLRNLVERGEFEVVALVERREDVGGVWYLEDPPAPGVARDRPYWPSPAYPALVGNVLPEYLSFSHHPFPALPSEDHPYPTLAQTHAYLRRFASPFLASGHIRLSTEVVWIDELSDKRGGWSVTLRDWRPGMGGTGTERVETWDAVVVATAWYDFPSWPEGVPGLRVVVVGNANSSNDIAAQLKSVARAPVYRSIRRQALRRFAFLPDPRVVDVPAVARYKLASNGKLDLELSDGELLIDIDAVVLGTGYKAAAAPRRSRPLLPPRRPPPNASPRSTNTFSMLPTPVSRSSARCSRTPPFTLADVASTYLTLVWRKQIVIPGALEARLVGEQARIGLVEQMRRETQDSNPSSFVAYHILGAAEQAYAQGLKDAVRAVKREWAEVLPGWDEEEWRRREGMYERKWVSLEKEAEKEKEMQTQTQEYRLLVDARL
ncbi:hypothetical protein C8F01DRAFT_1170731 [Mycena amicta]|nr:hypothetical protein C8F01DRAFT_1170731 [Mycena amicta]